MCCLHWRAYPNCFVRLFVTVAMRPPHARWNSWDSLYCGGNLAKRQRLNRNVLLAETAEDKKKGFSFPSWKAYFCALLCFALSFAQHFVLTTFPGWFRVWQKNSSRFTLENNFHSLNFPAAPYVDETIHKSHYYRSVHHSGAASSPLFQKCYMNF